MGDMKRLMSMDRAKSYGFTPTTELKDGTLITFTPDKNIFSNIQFDLKILKQRFREMAFLNPSIKSFK